MILKCLSNSIFSRTSASRWKGKLSCWCFFSRWIWTQILCSSDPECSSRVQISRPDPQMSSGALIHVPHYLSNLRFRVWKKMQETLKHSESLEDVKSLYTLCASNNRVLWSWSEFELYHLTIIIHKIIQQMHDDYKAQSIPHGVSLCIRFVFLIYILFYPLIWLYSLCSSINSRSKHRTSSPHTLFWSDQCVLQWCISRCSW